MLKKILKEILWIIVAIGAGLMWTVGVERGITSPYPISISVGGCVFWLVYGYRWWDEIRELAKEEWKHLINK